MASYQQTISRIGFRYPHSNLNVLVLHCPKNGVGSSDDSPDIMDMLTAVSQITRSKNSPLQFQLKPQREVAYRWKGAGTGMEQLNEELSALSAIFTANEFEVIWGDECLAVSFPLRFRLEIQFVITIIENENYDVLVQIIESENPPLELVQKAAAAAQAAAEEYMADRHIGEHRHLYSAHQRAVEAFDKRISSETSTSLPEKGSDETSASAEDATSLEEAVESAGGGALPETTVIILDHINDTKKYYKLLAKWSQQLNLSCIVLAKSPTNAKGDRTKHVVLIIQSVTENSEFLRRLKTENVDVNLAGKPCKERCASTILVSRKYDYLEMNSRFQIFDCSTAAAVALLGDKYKVPEIGTLVRNFCTGQK